MTRISQVGTEDTAPAGTILLLGETSGAGDVKMTIANLFAVANRILTNPKINDTSSNHYYTFAVSELTADRTVTLPLLTAADVFVFADFIQTLTNKRVTPRVTSEASSATPTINSNNSDIHRITALAVAITSMTSGLSGTPTHGQKLIVEFLDNGTARAITHGASFRSGTTATLLTTTVINKLSREVFMWDSVDSVFDCVGIWTEA